jgi:isopropylmalate/homocitrate/citramalate synthase
MIKIVEVGPRDGLQNEEKILPLKIKVLLIEKLIHSGLKNIEAGAFVSSKWVPQMADSDKLFLILKKKGILEKNKMISALVPNLVGLERAQKSFVKSIAVFGASSESFSKKNINCSVKESLFRFSEVTKKALKNKIKVRGYLSTAFGCPYEGKVPIKQVERLIKSYLDLGISEVSIGDTIGVATPKQVKNLLKLFSVNEIEKSLAMHFHDTRGTALANVLMSLDLGIRTFDSSVGGLGGCPYAKGASGNLATEDLVYLLNGMGLKSNVDIEELIKITHWLERSVLNKTLPSRLAKSGILFAL